MVKVGGELARFFGVGVDEGIDAVYERVRKARSDRQRAPGQVFDDGFALPGFVALGDLEQPLGRILAPVERRFCRADDIAEVAGRDSAPPVESNVRP